MREGGLLYRLLAGTTGLAIVFAICSMGAFIIAFCGRDE